MNRIPWALPTKVKQPELDGDDSLVFRVEFKASWVANILISCLRVAHRHKFNSIFHLSLYLFLLCFFNSFTILHFLWLKPRETGSVAGRLLFSFYFLYSAASINKSSRHQFAIFSAECLLYVGSGMLLHFSYRLYRTACTMDHTRRCQLLWIYLIFSHETILLPELLVAVPAIWYLSSRFLVCLHSLICYGWNTWCVCVRVFLCVQGKYMNEYKQQIVTTFIVKASVYMAVNFPGSVVY